jgi:tetratricopeptide (TPR) repeat protein
MQSLATDLRRITVFALACLAIAVVETAVAQTMAGHDMGQMVDVAPLDKLAPPLAMTGIGNSHLAIHTTSPEAQAWFDQSLNLYHDFWDYESTRAFEQAVRLDPQCAMCYWGLYQALIFRNGSGNAYARQALAAAVRLKKHGPKNEQLYIEAAVADAKPSHSKPDKDDGTPKDSKETKILRKLVKLSPNDLQAKIFLAGSVGNGYTDAGEPKAGTREEIAILEDVLKTAPNDSAANHYWIHAMEPSSHPERALPSARLLASLAPNSGHMVHMPGHIFYRVGDYEHAELWFAQSTAVDEAYMRSQHIPVDDDWNYVHNLMYGIANLMEEGKLQQATALSAKLANARGEFSATLYIGSPRDALTRLNTLLPIALREGDWAQVLKLLDYAKPNAKLENLVFLSGQLKSFAAGMKAVEANDITTAQAQSKALDADLDRMRAKLKATPKPAPKDDKNATTVQMAVMPDAKVQPLLSSLAIMSLELRASILAAQKDIPKAEDLFTQAAKAGKELGYREPPMYIRPVGETEGLALLRAGDAAASHRAYAAALEERPNSGFALYGMARASEAAGQSTTALNEYAKFLAAWKDSDSAASEMAHAREFVDAHPTVAALAHP